MHPFTDTHCHLDDPRFDGDRAEVIARAAAAGVTMQVIPAVARWNFDRVRELAHAEGLVYALGIHPMCVDEAADADLDHLAAQLHAHRDDPRLVAVGEIGVDHFIEGLSRKRQQQFFVAQLKLAREHGLPVLLHSRRAADAVIAGLNRIGCDGGIAHAFNGSPSQAERLARHGLAFGFGGAVTFERALNLRRLAVDLPLETLVLETDSPDIPPQWRYVKAENRAPGATWDQGRNEPAEVARIAPVLAALRGMPPEAFAQAMRGNTLRVLPRLAQLSS